MFPGAEIQRGNIALTNDEIMGLVMSHVLKVIGVQYAATAMMR